MCIRETNGKKLVTYVDDGLMAGSDPKDYLCVNLEISSKLSQRKQNFSWSRNLEDKNQDSSKKFMHRKY